MWRDVVGYDGLYRVSNTGVIKSVSRVIKRNNWSEQTIHGRTLRPYSFPGGYPKVTLCKCGKNTSLRIHRVVLEAFTGPCPDGMQCRHLDGDPSNNHISNLVWGTIAENGKDRIRHGTTCRGEDNGTSKLTEIDVKFIRHWLKSGHKHSKIADVFDVSQSTISHINLGTAWGWLT